MTTKYPLLTQHAVRNMCLGKALVEDNGGPLIVQIFNRPSSSADDGSSGDAGSSCGVPTVDDEEESSSSSSSSISVIVYDGQDHVEATVVLGSLTLECVAPSSLKVAVYSYICSEANSLKGDGTAGGPPPVPFLYIIPISIVSLETSIPNLAGRRPFQIIPSSAGGTKIKGGIAPKFFASIAPVLDSQALCGQDCSARFRISPSSSSSSRQQHDANAKIVTDFLAKQSAMTTLLAQNNNNNNNNHATSNNNNNNNNDHDSTQYYMSALREFQASQLDRQKSTLASNAGREDAQKSALIVRQHNKALTQALSDASPCIDLSPQLLCRWHAILCGEGVLANDNDNAAGVVRTKNVRVGHVHFQHHSLVKDDLDSLCRSLQRLEQRLLLHQAGRRTAAQQRAGVDAATFAACVFFGIGDVHAFCDGNGRLARLALQWALKRAGIPFCLHLFATPTQRKEYVQATVQTRRNLALLGQGQYSQEDLVHAYAAAGALGPLVDLILDRLAKTIAEFEKVVQTKSRLVTEEAEARAAKAVRDRERAGSCLICFDDNPNIGTLCCGKAVHLNCVAQWLSSNNTCPNCREEFPALPPRIMRAPPPQAAANQQEQAEDTESTTTTDMHDVDEDDDTTTTFSDDTDEDDDDDDDDTTEMEEDTNAAFIAALVAHQQQVAARAHDDETTEDDDDDDTMEDDTTTIVHQQQDDESTATDDSTTTGATAAGPSSSSHLPPFCVMNNCSNRSARDCSNNTCGRCCMMHGQYSCERHNT